MRRPPAPSGVTPATNDTDLASWLAVLAGRVRVHALAVRALAAGPDVNARTVQALADGLDDVAAGLVVVPQALCDDCRLAEVAERVEIRASAGDRAAP